MSSEVDKVRDHIRKWGSFKSSTPKYNIAYVIKHCNLALLSTFEPWCDRIYIDDDMQVLYSHYLDQEQHNTSYDLSRRVFCIGHNDPIGENDIVIEFDAQLLTQENINILHNFPEFIKDNGNVGILDLDIFKINIQHIEDLSYILTH